MVLPAKPRSAMSFEKSKAWGLKDHASADRKHAGGDQNHSRLLRSREFRV